MRSKISVVIGTLWGLGLLYLWTWSVGNAAPPPSGFSASAVSSPTTISNSSDDATRPTIAVGRDNTLYVAWEQAGETGGSRDPFYSQSANGTSWTTPQAVYTSTTNSLRPVMAAAPNGSIQIVWDEESGTTRLAYQKGLTGTTVITVPPVITQAASAHSIVVDSSNIVHLALQGNKAGAVTPFHILHSSKALNAPSWPQATSVYTGGVGTGSQYPALAADSQGHLHLAWQENVGSSDGQIYYSKGITGGGSIAWTAPISVSVGVVITNSARPSIAVDDNDTLHLVWEDRGNPSQPGPQYIYYAHSTDGGATWSLPTRVVSRAVRANHLSPSYVSPVIAVSGDTIYVAWHDSTGDSNDLEDVYYSYSTDGGATWATPVNVSQSDGAQSLYPQIAVDGQGVLHLVWQEMVGGTYVVQYAHTQRKVFLPIVLK